MIQQQTALSPLPPPSARQQSPTPDETDDITAPLVEQTEGANEAVGTADVGVKEGRDLGV